MKSKDYEVRARFRVEVDEEEHEDPIARLVSWLEMYFRSVASDRPDSYFSAKNVALKYPCRGGRSARYVRNRQGVYTVWVSILCRAEEWLKRAEVVEQATTNLNEFTLRTDDFGPTTSDYGPAIECVRIVRLLHEEVANQKEKVTGSQGV